MFRLSDETTGATKNRLSLFVSLIRETGWSDRRWFVCKCGSIERLGFEGRDVDEDETKSFDLICLFSWMRDDSA